MSVALDEAVRKVLDHGRNHKKVFVVPAPDFDALVRAYKANGAASGIVNGTTPYKPRDPEYEREMRQLFANAELDP